MRRIERMPARVPTLDDAGGSGFKKHQANVAAHDNPANNKKSFPDHWNKPDVRGLLYAQQGRVCAYCGSNLPYNDRGDVEHFRPKAKVAEDGAHGGYWWLAYDDANYVLSCRVCNSNRKGNGFPLRANAIKRSLFKQPPPIADEARLLIDPTTDQPEDLVTYDWESSLCSARCADNLTSTRRQQAEGVIDFFRLNLNPQLVDERIKIRDAALEAIQNGRENEAVRAAVRYQPHSRMVRQMLDDHGIAPPTPEMEFEVLMEQLLDLLQVGLALANAHVGGVPDELERLIDEMRWGLAILTEHTAIPGIDVEDRLHQVNVLDFIAQFRPLVVESG